MLESMSSSSSDSCQAYDIRCSTEGSTGVVLRDLRNVDRPGACMVAPP
jgi:hypothetical protein